MKVIRNLAVAVVVSAAALGYSKPAAAINYHELEVYGYRTANQGEREFENASSVSDARDDGNAYRSSFEFNYGLLDNIEIATYLDFKKLGASDQNLNLEAARVHARSSLFEKGQLPVDVGVYGELEFPSGEESKMEAEFKVLLEKDFGRLTLNLDPSIEQKVIGNVEHDIGFGYSTSVAYRLNETFRPHLDLFGDLSEEQAALLSPAVDAKLGRGFMVSARAGFGLNDAAEKALAGVRMEYEF